jgi:hypothetical protein
VIDCQIRAATAAPILSALVQHAIRTTNAADDAPAIIQAMRANFEPDRFLEQLAEAQRLCRA